MADCTGKTVMVEMEMEVWEEAVSPKEEEQFCFIQVEFEVVSSHPSIDVFEPFRDVSLDMSV